MAGETIDVIYRSRPVMRITPIGDQISHFSGKQTGKRLDELLTELPKSISPMMHDPNMTYKQLRDELYRRDPKYRKYLSKKSIDE
jgi:antitoxin (DNA-binding transcriptional repressor) of toxin-antitoxin stability system